jgi:hypothetical protein
MSLFLYGFFRTFILEKKPYNLSCMATEFIEVKKCKVNYTTEQAMKAQRGSRGIALLFLTSALDGGGWSTPRPGRFSPRE